MKKSIKWRITIIFIVVVSLCIGSIILFNTLMIEQVYVYNRVNVIKKAYEVLDDGIMNAYGRGYRLKDIFREINNNTIKNENKNYNNTVDSYFMEFLKAMQDRYALSIMLADDENNFYSLYKNSRNMDNRIRNYLFRNEENRKGLNTIEENEKYIISKYITTENQIQNNKPPLKNNIYASFSNINKNINYINERQRILPQPNNYIGKGELECFGFLSDNETVFLMTVPIVSMKESIDIFNNVLIMLSFISIFIGSIVIYFTSSRITEPIKEIANLSKKMSNLDFDTKYTGNRIDEIGILGNSMNEMSKKLENTIKDLKNANLKLQSDIEQKEKLDNMRKEFVANVSHELKTPIALIQGYAEGLEQGMAKTDEDKKYYLDVILDESSKMNRMVRQLLDLSSLEKDVDDLDIRRVNLYELVAQVIGAHELDIEQKHLNVSINIPNDLSIWVDEFKFEEVVRNYFTNAINHVDENKMIKLYTEKLTDDKIRFCVYNSGEKLSEENLSKIWEKFYKTDKARTRAYGGTGLGLSIVKIIADKHHTTCGCMNVDNNNKLGLKDGILFYFDLNIK